jgi:hypothetical protein
MRRRRFLHLCAGAALAFPGLARRALAAASAPAAPKPSLVFPPCADGLEIARTHILTYCATLSFPSGALHAIRAFGRETPLGPGDPFRLVLENFAQETAAGDKLCLQVPVEKEGHRNLMLMNLLEKGCEPELEFTVQGRRYQFRDFIDSARMLATYPGTLPIDEHSWTLIALAPLTPPQQPRWKNAFGDTVDLQQMIDDSSDALWRATERIRTADLTQPDPPRDCPVLAYACGGMHLLAALAVPLASGYATPERRRKFAAHMQTAMRRLQYDEQVIASVERQNVQLAGPEAARAVAFDARVKFLGHLLEVVRYTDLHGLYEFSPAERQAVRDAAGRLCAVLVGSRDMKFERYKRDRFHYESMTTGICHAYNALRPGPA